MGLGDWVKKAARRAGRTVGEASDEYAEGKIANSLPQDEDGRAKIVCRRYSERRAVEIQGGRPECFEAGDEDCESCVRDIAAGHVETWR